MTLVTWSAESSAAFSAAFHACSASGTYFVSPKRSSHTFERRSPGVRQRSMNSSVALPDAEELRDHGAVGVVAHDHGGRAVAAGRLVGAGRQAVAQVGGDDERRAPSPGGRSATRRRRSGRRRRSRARARRSRGAAPRGWWWRSSCRGTRASAVANHSALGCVPPARLAARAAPPRRPSWWCPRRRTTTTRVPLPPPDPNSALICTAVEAPVRDVAGCTQDPSHCRKCRPSSRTGISSPGLTGTASAGRQSATRRHREPRRAAVRQAPRRRARPRARADAGVTVRYATARPPRRRRGEGRAPGRRRVRPGRAARDDRPERQARRRDVPAQQPRQAQHRHRPEAAGGA